MTTTQNSYVQKGQNLHKTGGNTGNQRNNLATEADTSSYDQAPPSSLQNRVGNTATSSTGKPVKQEYQHLSKKQQQRLAANQTLNSAVDDSYNSQHQTYQPVSTSSGKRQPTSTVGTAANTSKANTAAGKSTGASYQA